MKMARRQLKKSVAPSKVKKSKVPNFETFSILFGLVWNNFIINLLIYALII
jgi:hypothetical protein